MTCEFCERPANWRFVVGEEYERFACALHERRVQTLIALDQGVEAALSMRSEIIRTWESP